MIKKKNSNPFNILWFTVMFVLMGIIGYAQDTTMSTPSTQNQYPPSSGQSSTSSQGQQSPSSQDLSFNTQATQLSNQLIQQTGLSTDKADKISQILVDYRDNIAKARTKDYQNNQQNSNKNQDVTGSQSRVDMTDILGDNVDQYYTGASPDLMSDYKSADKKADNKIQDVFDNDVQKSRYEQIKGQWWSSVKDKVFSSLSQNSQNQMK